MGVAGPTCLRQQRGRVCRTGDQPIHEPVPLDCSAQCLDGGEVAGVWVHERGAEYGQHVGDGAVVGFRPVCVYG